MTAFTGLRQGEVIGLTWDCVDFNKKTVRVYRQLQKERKTEGKYRFVSLKNDKQRFFRVADDVLNVLRRVKAKQSEWKLAAGDSWNNDIWSFSVKGTLKGTSPFSGMKKL